MTDTLNILAALITIGLGAIGWLAPRYTAQVLDIETGKTTMGLSEIRASAGALFIGMGAGAILLGTPEAYAIVGMAYAGAATGRLTSILRDGAPFPKAHGFFAAEVALAAWLIGANI